MNKFPVAEGVKTGCQRASLFYINTLIYKEDIHVRIKEYIL